MVLVLGFGADGLEMAVFTFGSGCVVADGPGNLNLCGNLAVPLLLMVLECLNLHGNLAVLLLLMVLECFNLCRNLAIPLQMVLEWGM